MTRISNFLNRVVEEVFIKEANQAQGYIVLTDRVGRTPIRTIVKPWWKSQILWINCGVTLLAAVEVALQAFTGNVLLDPEVIAWVLLGLGPLNAVLRVLTVAPLGFGREYNGYPRNPLDDEDSGYRHGGSFDPRDYVRDSDHQQVLPGRYSAQGRQDGGPDSGLEQSEGGHYREAGRGAREDTGDVR